LEVVALSTAVRLLGPVGRLARRAAACLFVALAMTACETPRRLPAVPTELAARATPSPMAERYLVARDHAAEIKESQASLAKERAWLAASGHTGPLPPMSMLAISGGGDDGAFGAGFLNGWTAAGTRPEFKVVTGVSTGALIAPFAFLGPKYDPVLKSVYTDVHQADIFRRRHLLSGFFGDAMSDTTPLLQLVSRHIDEALLGAIAAEYAKGRLLLVATTNLDSLEPVVWNMTAIAASKDPAARLLFSRILVASAAIPGVFPPMLIDVQVDGVHYQEMHVDGGAMAQVFLYPPGLRLADLAAAEGAERRRTLYIIRNARLDSDWANVTRRTLPIAARAIGSLLQTQGIGDLYRLYATSTRDGVEFNLAYIPASFREPHDKQFDQAYMRKLYQTGYDMALAGYAWGKAPPGFGPE